MENNNLDSAPTEQELENAGFVKKTHDEDGCIYTYSKAIGDSLIITIGTDHELMCSMLSTDKGGFIKYVHVTKAAINKEFEHFNQPLPQWEKPKPKVGEVWKNDFYVFLIIKDAESNVLKLEGETIEGGVDWINYETADYGNFLFDKFTKVADSLEQYYKEKFEKKSNH